MAETLKQIGKVKIGKRFAESIDHAAHTQDGVPLTVPIFRQSVDEDRAEVRIYVHFDDSVVGEVAAVQLVDNDGDVVAEAPHTFSKPANKGLYVAFKYGIKEMEVEAYAGL